MDNDYTSESLMSVPIDAHYLFIAYIAYHPVYLFSSTYSFIYFIYIYLFIYLFIYLTVYLCKYLFLIVYAACNGGLIPDLFKVI